MLWENVTIKQLILKKSSLKGYISWGIKRRIKAFKRLIKSIELQFRIKRVTFLANWESEVFKKYFVERANKKSKTDGVARIKLHIWLIPIESEEESVLSHSWINMIIDHHRHLSYILLNVSFVFKYYFEKRIEYWILKLKLNFKKILFCFIYISLYSN